MRIKNLLKQFLPYSARNIDTKFLKLMDKISQIENSVDDSGRYQEPNFLTQLKNSLDKTSPIFWDANRVHLGNNVKVQDTLFNTSSGDIYIEDDTFCGHRVCIITGSHDYSLVGNLRQTSIPEKSKCILEN